MPLFKLFYIPALLKGASITCEYTKLGTTRKTKMYLVKLAHWAARNGGSYINAHVYREY